MTNKPTEGPWKAVKIASNSKAGDVKFAIMPEEERLNRSHAIASVIGSDAKRNAPLLAAAPDLRRELVNALKWIESADPGCFGYSEGTQERPLYPFRDEVAHNISKAIAKADGRDA